MTGAGLIFAAWAGCIDPRTWPYASVVVMTAPIFALIMPVFLLADLIWSRKGALVAVLCIIAGYPAYFDNFPLHPGSHELTEAEKPMSWTLLSYNVHNFYTIDGIFPDSVNPMFTYIINSGADVVALQEGETFSPNERLAITPEQIDSMKSLYPYVMRDTEGQTLFSKFPVEAGKNSLTNKTDSTVSCGIYNLDIRGQQVSLFVVHLQSLCLSDDDIEMFQEMTSIRGKERPGLGEVRSKVFSKVLDAAVKRATQAEVLVQDIKNYGGPNTVVCGDFNDVPGSWALRRLRECGLREVYPEVGMGYMNTYNKSRFWFRIDHVLYRGDLRPVSMERGNLRASDHYPILTTFVLTGSEKD